MHCVKFVLDTSLDLSVFILGYRELLGCNSNQHMSQRNFV